MIKQHRGVFDVMPLDKRCVLVNEPGRVAVGDAVVLER